MLRNRHSKENWHLKSKRLLRVLASAARFPRLPVKSRRRRPLDSPVRSAWQGQILDVARLSPTASVGPSRPLVGDRERISRAPIQDPATRAVRTPCRPRRRRVTEVTHRDGASSHIMKIGATAGSVRRSGGICSAALPGDGAERPNGAALERAMHRIGEQKIAPQLGGALPQWPGSKPSMMSTISSAARTGPELFATIVRRPRGFRLGAAHRSCPNSFRPAISCGFRLVAPARIKSAPSAGIAI